MRAAELARLVKVTGRRRGGWYDGLCPAHPDKHTSFSFRDGDHALVVKCRAGCTHTQIVAALGRTVEDLQFSTAPVRVNAPQPVAEKRREVAIYQYRDEQGTLLYEVVRFEPKDFRPRIPKPGGGWQYTLPEGLRRVCYHLNELIGKKRVYWTEGEKDADLLNSLGLPATTGQGGSGAWRPEYASQLKAIGVQEVIVLPDADRPGEKYGQHVLAGCKAERLNTRLVRLWPSGTDGADVSDWFGVGHTVAELETLSAPPTYSVERRGDGYVVSHGDAVIEVARLYEHRDGGIDADFWASVKGNGLDPHWSRLNMAAPGSRATLAKSLLTSQPGVDWIALLDYTCQAVVTKLRTAQPAVPLHPKKPAPIYERFLIDGLIPLNKCSILYGDGGSLKSLMAMAIALAGLRQEPIAPKAMWLVAPLSSVLYLDWESDEQDHETRLWGLCTGYGVDPAVVADRIYYQPMSRPLHEAVPQIKRQLADRPADLIIVDSMLKAAGDDPIDVSGARRLGSAIREIGGTCLAISHISHEAALSQGQSRVIGSVMYQNDARATIECRAEKVQGAKVVTYSLPKANNYGDWGPAALRFIWTPDDVIRIESDTPDDSRVSLGTRILTALNSVTRSVNQLARETGASKDTIRKELTRLEKRGMATRVSEGGKGAGDETQWGRVDTKRGNEAWQ